MDPNHPHATCWRDARPQRSHPPLEQDLAADVCVVGAGIAGLTAAYRLARAGLDVVVVERDEVGAGETGRTSAHLASALDDRFHELARLHGAAGARLAQASHAAAIDWIEGVIGDNGIDCGFRRVDGYLFRDPGSPADELDREAAAAREAGQAVDILPRIPGLAFDPGPCLRFPRQAAFHPLRYLHALAELAIAAGVRVFEHSPALAIAPADEGGVRTRRGAAVMAAQVVVATNVPVNDRIRVHTWLEPYRSYCMTIAVPAGAMPDALIWDTGDPYHYLRLVRHGGNDLLLIGGEDHKTGQGPDAEEAPFARLEAWVRERFPGAGAVVDRWSGQIVEPVDDLALIGRNPGDDDVFIIAGDSGNGLTHGTLGGMILSDLVRGRDHPWAELYRPDRMRLGALGEFAKHNADVARQYGDWLSAGDVPSAAAISVGAGAVIRHGLAKHAVYRSPDGAVHACSAVCPHLGGLVRWNASEESWDCPCHGSRFDPYGKVINGPANADLERLPAGGEGGSPPRSGGPAEPIPRDRQAGPSPFTPALG